METPEAHNKKFWRNYGPPEEWSKIDLICPKCSTQLEVNNSIILPSNPPQRRVRCPKCGYIDSIY